MAESGSEFVGDYGRYRHLGAVDRSALEALKERVADRDETVPRRSPAGSRNGDTEGGIELRNARRLRGAPGDVLGCAVRNVTGHVSG